MYRVSIGFPGKMLKWKNGNFRTPLTLIVKNDKELKELEVVCKAHGISKKHLIIEKLEKVNHKEIAKNIKKENIKQKQAKEKLENKKIEDKIVKTVSNAKANSKKSDKKVEDKKENKKVEEKKKK